MTEPFQTVECYSGSRYAERPVAVHVDGQRLAVEQILHQWRTPAGLGFDVQVAGGRRFRLVWDQIADTWRLEEFERGIQRTQV